MKIKKIISLLLATAVSISMLTLPVFAASSDSSSDFTIENGVLTKYNGSGGDVTIPNSVTSIGDSAFIDCANLTSVTIPSSVTKIGDSVFCYCTRLTTITVDANNPNYTSADGILFSKDKTKLIEYPAGSTQIAYIIPSSVTSIGDAAFYGCTSLTTITIPSSVTSIGGEAFSGCTGLTTIAIPSSVTSIGEGAFTGCTGLTTVTIPSSVTSIGDAAFCDCTNLTTVTIPSSVTNIGDNEFCFCTSLTTISVDANNPNYTSVDGILFSKDKTKLIEYPAGIVQSAYIIPNSVTSIGQMAFFNCIGLTTITIPNSVTNIGGGAFECCNSLTVVAIPNSVTSIGKDAFYDCTGLTTVTIPNSVTSIGDALFSGCEDLTTITIPNSVKSIGKAAFSGCTNLTTATIPNSVTSIGDLAYDACQNLTSVTIPNSVTNIGDCVFRSCTRLTTITVDANNPNYTSADGILFSKDKTKLIQYPTGNTQTVYIIPNSVTSIGLMAFSDCVNIATITIPNSVTNIGDGAFESCWSLTVLDIPNSVTSIGKAAFVDCQKLKSITISSSVTSIGDDVFGACDVRNLTIHGSKGSYAQTYATKNKLKFSISPTFGTPAYSTKTLTNGDVTVTIPVTGATVSSVSHTFTANSSYTFTVTDKVGNKATKTVKVSNIDKIKPTVKVSIGNGKSTTGKVSVTVSDTNLKSKSVKLNGKTISWPKNNIFKVKGKYAVTATDKAGNRTTASFSIVK